MFGAHPFGEPYFGQAPNRTALVILFGAIRDTALVSLNAARRLLRLTPVSSMQGRARRTMTHPKE
jgi:hypothetical protein